MTLVTLALIKFVLKVQIYRKALEAERSLTQPCRHGSSHEKGQFEAVLSNIDFKKEILGTELE